MQVLYYIPIVNRIKQINIISAFYHAKKLKMAYVVFLHILKHKRKNKII